MKLQAYVLRQLVVSLALSVGGILLVALPGIAVRAVHKIPSAEAEHLARFLAISLQNLVPYVLPICFLLATVTTFGRLAADREWIAIQMAGVRPARLLLPPLGMAVVLGSFSFFLLSYVLPGGKLRQQELLIEATSSALANLGPGGTSLSLDDGRIVLEALWYDEQADLLHEVFLRKGAGPGQTDYHADSARIRIVDRELRAELFDLFVVERTEGRVNQGEFASLEVRRVLERPPPPVRSRYLTTPVLLQRIRAGEIPPGHELDYRYRLHHRAALSAAFLVFALLGPATGLIARRGTQLGALGISMAYALAYNLLQMQIAKDLGTNGTLQPALAAWSPVVLAGVVATVLLRKALAR